MNKIQFVSFDRFSIDISLHGEAYYKLLAKEIMKVADGKKVELVGFSIGAFVALQTSRYLLNNQVNSLHLVSTAAPLDGGNFLEAMAGKVVFKVAKRFPRVFTLLSYWQSLVALVCPKILFSLLFATATGRDKDLVKNIHFQKSMLTSLRSCFLGRLAGYLRDVKAYVQPWKHTLPEINAKKIYLYHGTEDNWTPIAMAEYLQSVVPKGSSSSSSLTVFEKCAHYSCLQEAIPLICETIIGKTT